MATQRSKIKGQRSASPVCLTIAGLDPSGGAGIVADVNTFAAFGCSAAAVVTSVTFQNVRDVFGAVHQTADSVQRQIEAVLDDYEVAAVKTGVLPTREIVEAVAEIVAERRVNNLVVDPVYMASSGFTLIEPDAFVANIERLFPLAALVTPNIPEAERIVGFEIKAADEIESAAKKMLAAGARNVLIKGGHLLSAECGVRSAELGKAVDRLFFGDGNCLVFEDDFVPGASVRGTGCRLASAIAAGLAKGSELTEAVRAAKEFVTSYIRAAA